MTSPYFGQTVQHGPKTGDDENGQPRYGATVEYKGRWVAKRRRILNPQGEEKISEITALLPVAAVVTPGDRLALAGGAWSRVMKVEDGGPDLGGSALHRVVYL